eukprot:scaffold265870_cov30-Tisochrysis_lutea.AAC.2
MEDRTVCKLEDCVDRPHGYFAIFDGHGGSETAVRSTLPPHLGAGAPASFKCMKNMLSFILVLQEHCAENLHRNMLESRHFPDFRPALQDAFLRTDASFLRWAAMNERRARESNAGAAGLTCVITPTQMTLAHAGDCRAILVKHASCAESFMDLTKDHAADEGLRADEMRRVREAGAHTQPGYVFVGEHNLPMTRAFGNLRLKVARGDDWRLLPVSSQVVTAFPEISTYTRSADDLAVVIASDGLFGDVLSSAEVAQLTREVLQANAHTGDAEGIAARRLVDAAIRHQSSDNVSVVVISLDAPDTDCISPSVAPPDLNYSSSEFSISGSDTSPEHSQSLRKQTREPFGSAYPSPPPTGTPTAAAA